MKSIQNSPNETYKKILDEILINADFENKEIWFMDIYNYLEKINKKELMPLILNDLKKLGLKVILNKTYSEFKNFTISK
jgi:hypothetical protein